MATVNQNNEKKEYHKQATGEALKTVQRRSEEHELKLFGACFCPFVQRVWISLEVKDLDYQYIEVDPYKKPKLLTDINPRGLVPALKHGDWGCHESNVLLEYLEEISDRHPLFPSDPKARADTRLWVDHINRNVIPGFYRLLQAQDVNKQTEFAQELKTEIAKLVDAADAEGPFFLGRELGFVDVSFAPWMIRLSRVLAPYRGWPVAAEESRFGRWIKAIERHPSVKKTTSDDALYLDSYERYAENRPNTSQVANAVNSGRGLP